MTQSSGGGSSCSKHHGTTQTWQRKCRQSKKSVWEGAVAPQGPGASLRLR